MSKKDTLWIIGQKCAILRKTLKLTEKDVADDTGYTIYNIRHFERGENNNAILLLWYVAHGLDLR